MRIALLHMFAHAVAIGSHPHCPHLVLACAETQWSDSNSDVAHILHCKCCWSFDLFRLSSLMLYICQMMVIQSNSMCLAGH